MKNLGKIPPLKPMASGTTKPILEQRNKPLFKLSENLMNEIVNREKISTMKYLRNFVVIIIRLF